MRRFSLIVLIATALVTGPAYAIGMCGSGQRINCIVDGDTFWLNGEKFRASGYDTPEPYTGLCGGTYERQLANQASQRLVELFNTTEISLERRGTDRYGRGLVIVRSNGEPVADILVREGLARYYPNGSKFWCN